MSLALKLFKFVCISIVSYFYSEYILTLVASVQFGDLFKYSDLYQGLPYYNDFFGVLGFQYFVIGSGDPLYSFFLRSLFVPFFDFNQYIQIQVFLFSFLLGCLFFRDKQHFREPLRYLFFLLSLFSIYSLGLSTTILRLQFCLILIFFAENFFEKSVIRYLFYLLAILTHISSSMIVLSLSFSSLPNYIRPFSLSLPPLKLSSRVNLKKLLFAFILLGVLFRLAYSKIIVWLPVIISGATAKSIISSFFIFALLYPLIANKQAVHLDDSTNARKGLLIIICLAPIILITLLIGSFRTLILAYFMSLIRLSSTKTSFFNSSSMLRSPYPYFLIYSMISGILFVNKLFATGYGY